MSGNREQSAGREIQNVLECSRYQMWISDHGAKGEPCEENNTFSFLPIHLQSAAGSFLTLRHQQFYIKTMTRSVAFMTDGKRGSRLLLVIELAK